MMTSVTDPRHFLSDLFGVAVAAADPMACVPAALDAAFSSKPDKLLVIGAGKASARMAEAVEAHWGPCDGFVITRYGYERPTKGIEIVSAAHPVPDQAGVDATRHLLALVKDADPATIILGLISGGGSALLCAPADGITLAEKQQVNAALLASGAPIDQMNILRKHISAIKGGQLAGAAAPKPFHNLIISDVAGDDLAFIASGPTVGDATTPKDALAIIARYNLDVPQSVLDHLTAGSGVLAQDDNRLCSTTNCIVAAPSQSLEAAAEQARAQGIAVEILGDDLEGEARDLGQAHAQMALQKRGTGPHLLLSGGECTVTRTGDGIGGPNAEYTLAAAIALAGQDGVYVMACDTDGVDGAAEVAGALCDGTTVARAQALGVDATAALARNDAHNFFARLGDQVITGPTLTNVNDFRAILIE